jgi:hypothetical protein
VFLQKFPEVDEIVNQPRCLENFNFTVPGYNDGGPGQRILHVGEVARVANSLSVMNAFLNVMTFATNADRTNAVAAALTVMLRHLWPGGKPVLVVTSTKSHGGKDTVILFASGSTARYSISYEATDWALEKAFVVTLKHAPQTGVVSVENARLGKGGKVIASAFLERFVTDSHPVLYSPGTGTPVRRQNDVVVAISTNFGLVSEDLMNRALPIHLSPVGNIADRQSPIGNPKLEYLPANREQIEAELRGMIERWKAQGEPRDTSIRHPFTAWAKIIGGILRVNGFDDFLGNCTIRKTADDPVRRALGILGAWQPDRWLRTGEWVKEAVSQGLIKNLIAEGDRNSDKGCERGMGFVLTQHEQETFEAENDDERLTVRLEKARRRFEPGEPPTVRYRFVVLSRASIPEDEEPTPSYSTDETEGGEEAT